MADLIELFCAQWFDKTGRIQDGCLYVLIAPIHMQIVQMLIEIGQIVEIFLLEQLKAGLIRLLLKLQITLSKQISIKTYINANNRITAANQVISFKRWSTNWYVVKQFLLLDGWILLLLTFDEYFYIY